ncbi:MAG: TetR/AcrR family transcriptional regulator, partial [Clostridia bacterium]
QTRLFEEMMNRGVFRRDDPQAAAFHFYAPIFLLLNMYAEKKDQTEEALALLDRQIAAFYRLYRVDKEEQ